MFGTAPPVLAHGDAESIRIDIAASFSGRLGKVAVKRGRTFVTRCDRARLRSLMGRVAAERQVYVSAREPPFERASHRSLALAGINR